MLKNLLKLALLIVLAGSISYGIYEYRDYYLPNPFDKTVQMNQIFKINTDSQRNMYIIADSKESIEKLNANGSFAYKIRQPKAPDANSFYLFSGLVPDGEGRLYVHRTLMDINGLFLKAEDIVRYKVDGSIDESWQPYVVDRSDNKDSLRQNIVKHIWIEDGQLYAGEMHGQILQVRPIKSNTGQAIKRVELPINSYISDLYANYSGEVWYTTRNATLYSSTKGLLYPLHPSDAIQVPAVYPEAVTHSGGAIYFFDEYRYALKRLSLQNPGQVESIVSAKDIERRLGVSDEFRSFAVLDDGSLIVATSERLFSVSPTGQIKWIEHPQSTLYLQFLFGIGALIAVALLVYGIKIIYANIMPTSIIFKQLFILIPAIVILMSGLSTIFYNYFSKGADDETERGLLYLAHSGQNLINGGRLSVMHSPQDFMNADYKELKTKILFEDHYGKFYTSIYKLDGNSFYYILEDDDNVRMFDSYSTAYIEPGTTCRKSTDRGELVAVTDYRDVIEHHGYLTCRTDDEQGSWLYALGPLFNEDKTKVVGMFETGINRYLYAANIQNSRLLIAETILVITGVLILLLLAVVSFIMMRIRKLQSNVTEIADGNYATRVMITSRDEVAALGKRVNNMAESIETYIQEVKALNKSYYRFVPQQFLKYLGKSNILDVKLGDQSKREMTVFVTNIHKDDWLSSDISPEDSFRFINDFLACACPEIRKLNGQIGNYTGKGFLALFAERPQHAVMSAIAMRKALEKQNERRQKQGIDLLTAGIGIHFGSMMLGIVGEGDRLDGSVISDAVNFTNKLEQMSSQWGASIIVTEEVFRDCTDIPNLSYRCLGMVQVDGANQPVRLYDVFEGDSEQIRSLKILTKTQFEAAVGMFQEGQFEAARSAFLAVIRQNQWDNAAKLYFYKSDVYNEAAPDEDWDGSISA